MQRAEGTCQVVVGAQWGDEGKGKIVDVLAERADVVARFQGGSNAGHTVVVGGEEFILHQVPSGILHPGKQCLLGSGVVLDPEAFFEELEELETRGIDTASRVWISDRAHLLLPYHKMLDRAAEGNRGQAAIGTTGRGIGPAYEDKIARVGIRLADVLDPDRLRERIDTNVDIKQGWLERLGSDERVDGQQVFDQLMHFRDRLVERTTDVSRQVAQHLAAGRCVLLEGAQGSQLDIDHGTYPYVTSSTTTAGGAATGIGLGPKYIDQVIGVVKAYSTRVGNGPLPTEIEGSAQEVLREAGGEYGATTGRARRCGWFDAVVVRYAARVNSLTELAVTKLDVLDGFDSIPLCTGYRATDTDDSDAITDFPANLALLERCDPIYEEHPGWRTPTGEARSWSDLPPEARQYVERIEALVGVPITRISVGQARKQVLER